MLKKYDPKSDHDSMSNEKILIESEFINNLTNLNSKDGDSINLLRIDFNTSEVLESVNLPFKIGSSKYYYSAESEDDYKSFFIAHKIKRIDNLFFGYEKIQLRVDRNKIETFFKGYDINLESEVDYKKPIEKSVEDDSEKEKNTPFKKSESYLTKIKKSYDLFFKRENVIFENYSIVRTIKYIDWANYFFLEMKNDKKNTINGRDEKVFKKSLIFFIYYSFSEFDEIDFGKDLNLFI